MNTKNTTTTTTITVNEGFCQFNVKTAKDLRVTLAKWHNATFEIADELLAKNDRVKALRTLIDSNNALIAKLEKGESIISDKSITDLQTENAEFEAKIKSENDAMAEYRKAQSDRLESAEKLVTKELYNAYVGTDDLSYFDAIAQFLSDNGITPCKGTITLLVLAIGKKTNSARNMCKTGKHNGNFAFNQWRKIFLGELCDMMGDTLPLYKFKYELKSNRKSKNA